MVIIASPKCFFVILDRQGVAFKMNIYSPQVSRPNFCKHIWTVHVDDGLGNGLHGLVKELQLLFRFSLLATWPSRRWLPLIRRMATADLVSLITPRKITLCLQRRATLHIDTAPRQKYCNHLLKHSACAREIGECLQGAEAGWLDAPCAALPGTLFKASLSSSNQHVTSNPFAHLLRPNFVLTSTKHPIDPTWRIPKDS